MQGVGTTGWIIETGSIDAERLDTLLIRAWILADILLGAVEPVECSCVEKERVSFTHISTTFSNYLVNVYCTDISARLFMEDINRYRPESSPIHWRAERVSVLDLFKEREGEHDMLPKGYHAHNELLISGRDASDVSQP